MGRVARRQALLGLCPLALARRCGPLKAQGHAWGMTLRQGRARDHCAGGTSPPVNLSLHAPAPMACDGRHEKENSRGGIMTTPAPNGQLQATAEDVRDCSTPPFTTMDEGQCPVLPTAQGLVHETLELPWPPRDLLELDLPVLS